jgi:hypothetical protein
MLYFLIEYEQDGDLSWLEPGEDPNDYVELSLRLMDGVSTVDSLGCISFLERDSDWVTGCFDTVADIPARCTHLREIAADMLDTVNRAEADRYLSLL